MSYTQDHWPVIRAAPEISFRKSHHISVMQNGSQNLPTLSDILNLLKEFNLSFQGRMTTVFKLADKVAAFKAKLELCGQWVNAGIFQTSAEILKQTEPAPSFSQLLHDHLPQFSIEPEHYFPTTKDPRPGKEWIHNPFVNEPGKLTLAVLEEDHCFRLKMTVALKVTFQTVKSPHFLGSNQGGIS